MGQSSDQNKIDTLVHSLKAVLDQRVIGYEIDESNPLSPELLFSDGKKLVVGESEILFVHGFNSFLNDYKYEIFYLGDELILDDLARWVSMRL